MSKPFSIALFVVGIVLIVYGINAADSFGSELSRFFTGTPSEKAIWLTVAGLAAVIVGGFRLIRGK